MTEIPLKPKKKRFDGWAMVVLAALLFWIGEKYDYAPQAADHKFIVATEKLAAPDFKSTVVFVIQHLHRGSTGFILNQPAKEGDYFIGGPMEKDHVYALHSLDARVPETIVLDDANLGFVEGKDAIDRLLAAKPAPKWHAVFKGHAGWGRYQLEHELKDGNWEIIDFNEDLLRKTPPEKMWDRARRMPMIRRTY